MTKILPKVTLDLDPLTTFGKKVNSDLLSQTNGPVREAMRQWAVRYRAFAQKRYSKFSRGGGDWPPLKRKRKRGGTSILIDTGAMFRALSPTFIGLPGQFEEHGRFVVTVGYGGAQKHPKGRATIADIASFHQDGLGSLPVRKTIVDPPSNVVDAMRRDMDRALQKMIK